MNKSYWSCLEIKEEEIFKILKSIGCCFICATRFCFTTFVGYDINPKMFIQQIPTLDDDPEPSADACIVCLGILQHNKITSFLDKLITEINILKNDCSTVSLALTIPIAIQIRERAVLVYLNKHNYLSSQIYKNKVKLENIKEVWKWYLCHTIESLINKRMEITNVSSPFTIDVFMSYICDQEECQNLWNNYSNLSKDAMIRNQSRKFITKKNIDAILNLISNEEFEKCFSVPPSIPEYSINIDKLVCTHNSIFIGGRYKKLSRRICQTPWFVKGKNKMDTSIQELICNYFIHYTKAQRSKFLSSGREDVDVRMILFGRPFAIELVNPQVTEISENDLESLNNKINNDSDKVKTTNGLKLLSKNDLKLLKIGEYSKVKSYRALCIFKETVNDFLFKKVQTIQNLKIIQNTPLRVLHRRSLYPRERTIFELRARYPSLDEIKYYQKSTKYMYNSTFIILDLKTQAGTYVKEFIHGDFGRTHPNLSNLFQNEIDILALDVTNIALNWP